MSSIYTTHPDQEPPRCPSCTFTTNLACTQCGSGIYSCGCHDWNEWYCFTCEREFITGDSVPLDSYLFDENEYSDNTWDISLVDPPTKLSKSPSLPAHEHKHQPLTLPGGSLVVHCSQLWNDRPEADQPDFGLYAETKWNPTWRNEFINWPDYGIPKDLATACIQIGSAYVMIEDGSDVEIGCWGGHGRTGTILACMVLLDMRGEWTADQAIAWVKTSYCDKAIEVDEQKWFIKYFSNKHYGTVLPDISTVSKHSNPSLFSSSHGNASNQQYQVGANCSALDHYAMYLRGHRKCATKEACRWWQADLDNFELDSFPTGSVTDNDLGRYELKFSGKIIDTDFAKSHDQTQHYAMFRKGWESCALLGSDCGYWEEDFDMFTNHPHLIGKWVDAEVAEKLLDDYPNWSGTNVRDNQDLPMDPE